MATSTNQKIAADIIESGKIDTITDPAEIARIIRDHAKVISDLDVLDVMRTIRDELTGTGPESRLTQPMTIGQLVAELQRWPQDATVQLTNARDKDTSETLTGVSVSTVNKPFNDTVIELLLATVETGEN